jgi:hypothetical protein
MIEEESGLRYKISAYERFGTTGGYFREEA